MHLARRLPSITKDVSVRLIKTSVVSTSSAAKEEIVVPKRIERSPTAILEALSATVGRDPTAPNYKYHDDPYLIPSSNVGKRTYAMAQESGRKAAQWIKEQHRDLFQVSFEVFTWFINLMVFYYFTAPRGTTTN